MVSKEVNFYRHVIGVDVIGALLIVDRLKFESTVIVRKNIREAIFRPVTRQIRCGARLVPSDVLQFFKLLRKSKVRIRRHGAIMLSKIFNFDGPAECNSKYYAVSLQISIFKIFQILIIF